MANVARGERSCFEARKMGPKSGGRSAGAKTDARNARKSQRSKGFCDMVSIKSAMRAARAVEADDARNDPNGCPIARERRLAERQPPYRLLAAPLARQRSIRSPG